MTKQEYPMSKRRKIVELDISGQNLFGNLELEGFTNLKELNCINNLLNSLEVTKSFRLREIHCSANQIYLFKSR